MDKETANYITSYFSNLMTDDEMLALKQYMYTAKTEDNPEMKKWMVERGWISDQPAMQEFLKNGYDEFELKAAIRIVSERPGEVFFNDCPKCNRLARTPYARQCRHCGHTWHELTVAQFKLEGSFQLTDREFFLFGKITRGEIMKGQFIDLTMLGLNKKPRIEAIEFLLKRQDGKVWEDIAVGTNDLTEQDKEYVKRIGSFGTPVDIIKER